MLTRRALAKFLGAAALSGGLPFGLAAKAIAQIAAPPTPRGTYLIKNGAVVTVDEILGTLPRADVLVRDGRIAGVGPDLAAADAEVIDASDMIVMPGFVDTHYHMWSALGRNFTADGGFGYFPAKNATSKLTARTTSTTASCWGWWNSPMPASPPCTTGRTTRAPPLTPTPS